MHNSKWISFLSAPVVLTIGGLIVAKLLGWWFLGGWLAVWFISTLVAFRKGNYFYILGNLATFLVWMAISGNVHITPLGWFALLCLAIYGIVRLVGLLARSVKPE